MSFLITWRRSNELIVITVMKIAIIVQIVWIMITILFSIVRNTVLII